MPLSNNINEDFVYCIQNIQTNFMGYLLQPLTNITGSIATIMTGLVGEINGIRQMFDKIRSLSTLSIQSIFGVFMNMVIEFQKIIISIKDLMAKTIGTIVSMLYVMDGSMKTLKSAWDGPPGQMIQKVGKCFHPETKLKLKNGSVVNMKDIQMGDVLESGSVVVATMKIDNSTTRIPFYKIKENEVNSEYVYVTGSHMIHDSKTDKFISVEKHTDAELTNETYKWFSCLITDDHLIKIGNVTFWDWEDYYCK